jgi:hypothetical protein
MTTMTETHQHTWSATIAPTDERAELWREAFGGLTVPIVSPIFEAANLAGRGVVAAYQLDVAAFDDEARYRAAHALARSFGDPLQEVWGDLGTNGLPLIADGLRVGTTCCDYHPHDDVDRHHDEMEVLDSLATELAECKDDGEQVDLHLSKLQAFVLMGVLQIALKHPHLMGEPLQLGIQVTRELQEATCPPGSARERVALCGWTGR